MSRIGKLPISIPAGVTVNFDANSNVVTVKGPKGELSQKIDPSIKFNNQDGQIVSKLMRTAQLILSRSKLSMVCIVHLFTTWLLV